MPVSRRQATPNQHFCAPGGPAERIDKILRGYHGASRTRQGVSRRRDDKHGPSRVYNQSEKPSLERRENVRLASDSC